MEQEVLENIGLTKNEGKIYIKMLSLESATMDEISSKTGIHRRNVYDAVEKLVQRGIVIEEFVSGKRLFMAGDPEKLSEILEEKKKLLFSVMPSLEEKFTRKIPREIAVIYRGIEGFKNYFNDILKTNETVCFIGAKGFWLDERLKYVFPKFDKQRLKQKIKLRHLYDWEVKQNAKDILKLRLNKYKFLPIKYSSSTSITIFGDHVVSFYGIEPGKLSDEPTQFHIISRPIADGYRKIFEALWEKVGMD